MNEIQEIEDRFKVNVVVYELVEQYQDQSEDDHCVKGTEEKAIVAQLVRRSLDKYTDTMYLNLYSGNGQCHFSYINNINRYCKSYGCRKCNKLWKSAKQLHRHEVTCEFEGKSIQHNRMISINNETLCFNCFVLKLNRPWIQIG